MIQTHWRRYQTMNKLAKESLCTPVIEHRGVESEGLGFDS